MQGFEFKPALLRGRDNWTIDSGMLTRNGELYCSFANVKAARFAQMTTSRNHTAWLDLKTDRRRNRIACNFHPASQDYQAFNTLCLAIMDELDRAVPDTRVAIGAGGGVRWSMFILGLLTAVFGVFMTGMGLAGRVNDGTVLFAAMFGLGAVAFGLWLGWTFRPWAPPLTLSPSEARSYLARFSAEQQPAETEEQGEAPEQPER